MSVFRVILFYLSRALTIYALGRTGSLSNKGFG